MEVLERTTPRAAPPPRARVHPAVVVLVAVVLGLSAGRFVLADGEAAPVVTTQVRASPDLATQVAQLERAVAADPSDLTSLQSLSTAYVGRAVQTGDASFYALAQRAVERAERLRPGDAKTLLAQGLLALSLHDFPRALEVGTRARALRPDSPVSLGVVVDAQVELGRYEQAAGTLEQLLQRDPGLPALARTSYLRELNGDLDGAVAAMRAAVDASSDPAARASVQTLLAGLLLQRGDVGAADEQLGKALADGLAPPAARVQAARVLAARGDLPGAVRALEEAVAAQPIIDALVLLRQLQQASGAPADAEATAATVRAVASLQEAAGQIVDLEMALFETTSGDPVRGLQLGRAAHDVRPDNVFAADALGWAALRTGDTATAREALGRALRLGGTTPSLRWHAAELAAADGDLDAARRHLAPVLAAAPWDPALDTRAVVALADRLSVPLPASWAAAR